MVKQSQPWIKFNVDTINHVAPATRPILKRTSCHLAPVPFMHSEAITASIVL